jgi:S1-C subfamily serine protease
LKRQPEAASALAYLSEVHQKLGNSPASIETRARALKKFAEQGNQYQVQVMKAWLQVNDPSFETELAKPEHTAQRKREEYAIEARPQAQAKPAVVKTKRLISESEQTFAVQRFPFPANVVITGGSGFIVDSGRKVVTNRHVVEDGKEFAIRTGLGEVIKAKVVFLSKTDDLAILELEKPLPSERAIPNTGFVKPKVGRNVVVMGYPLWYILGEGSPSLTNGVVSKRTGLSDDQATFQITAKVNKGNSGGPVFDMRGNVVGITVGKLDLKKISDDQGFLPEDVNFAIHVDRLPKLIGMAVSSEETKDELSAEELYQAMVGKVVMVATYK